MNRPNAKYKGSHAPHSQIKLRVSHVITWLRAKHSPPRFALSFHSVVTLSEQEGVCGYLAFAGALRLTKSVCPSKQRRCHIITPGSCATVAIYGLTQPPITASSHRRNNSDIGYSDSLPACQDLAVSLHCAV